MFRAASSKLHDFGPKERSPHVYSRLLMCRYAIGNRHNEGRINLVRGASSDTIGSKACGAHGVPELLTNVLRLAARYEVGSSI